TSIPHALSMTTSIENILSTALNIIGGWCSNQNRINLPCVLPVREHSQWCTVVVGVRLTDGL
ncbi:hypothetical protein KW850_32705, partial [Bacillus sp. sid0103]|uniref:hypothetical protein n=1 Tax=Bacillus sp. sid0103 TaxID=2856337 RepID=UPI001C459288